MSILFFKIQNDEDDFVSDISRVKLYTRAEITKVYIILNKDWNSRIRNGYPEYYAKGEYLLYSRSYPREVLL